MFIHYFPSAKNEVFLTFDDGPNPKQTGKILDLLESYGAYATFFVIGKKVLEKPDLSKELVKRGHAIGVHAFDHTCFVDEPMEKFISDYEQCSRVIEDVCGVTPKLYRAPYGKHTPAMEKFLEEKGVAVVGWSAVSRDWVNGVTKMKRKWFLTTIFPGIIHLLHDGWKGRNLVQGSTFAIVESAMTSSNKMGLRYCSLDEGMIRYSQDVSKTNDALPVHSIFEADVSKAYFNRISSNDIRYVVEMTPPSFSVGNVDVPVSLKGILPVVGIGYRAISIEKADGIKKVSRWDTSSLFFAGKGDIPPLVRRFAVYVNDRRKIFKVQKYRGRLVY